MRLTAAALLAGFVTLSLAGMAHAQAFRFDPTAADVSTQVPAIEEHVTTALAELTGADKALVGRARDRLVAPLRIAGAAEPSPGFLDAYARVVAARFDDAIARSDVNARVNLAIAVSRIAERTQSPRLVPAVTRLLNDESTAIVLWGLRAAAPLTPLTAKDPNATLIDAVVATTFKFPDSGPIVAEAYGALTSVSLDSELGRDPVVVGRLVRAIHQILENRLAGYAAGSIPEPSADERGVRSVTNFRVWGLVDADLRTRSIEYMSQLLAGVNAKLTEAINTGGGARSDAEQFRTMLRALGSSSIVLGEVVSGEGGAGAAELRSAGERLRRLSGASPAAQITRDVNALLDALRLAFPKAQVPTIAG